MDREIRSDSFADKTFVSRPSMPLLRMSLVVLIAVSVAVAVFVWRSWQAELNAPLERLDVIVVGNDYRLYFRYPGQDGVLGTTDDRFGTQDLIVPETAEIRLTLRSHDYIYLMEVPDYEVYDVAAPDLEFEVRFETRGEGTHDLLGSQMCGYDHPELLGNLYVQTPAQFRQSMKRLSKVPLTTAQ